MSVNRTELIAAIAEEADLTKVQADAFLAAFQKVLVDNVAKGEAVKITGLMGVERVERAARTGRNPRTGDPDPRRLRCQADGGLRFEEGRRQVISA